MSIWIKIVVALFVISLGTGAVLAYNHAITKVEKLSNDLNNANDRIKLLESSAATQEQNAKDFALTIQDQNLRFDALEDANRRRQSYIGKAYAGATNEKRTVLDTDLPEYRCVFDGTCDAPAGTRVPPPAK